MGSISSDPVYIHIVNRMARYQKGHNGLGGQRIYFDPQSRIHDQRSPT